ncbi:MAG TPA: hypothetical protein VK614_00055 [Allosphingosinicella sp.]|nr:hypothetical protein [Allosphingosinicella sp.]
MLDDPRGPKAISFPPVVPAAEITSEGLDVLPALGDFLQRHLGIPIENAEAMHRIEVPRNLSIGP